MMATVRDSADLPGITGPNEATRDGYPTESDSEVLLVLGEGREAQHAEGD